MDPLTLTVSFPSSVRHFIDQELADGHYRSPEELVASLIGKAARKKQVFEKIEALLTESEIAGEVFDWNPHAFEEMRAGILEVRKKKADEKLAQLVEAAMASGEPTPFTKQDWEQIRGRVKERIAFQNNGKSSRARK